ncbi:hypothetical protein TWF281_008646 [Arthrobotrys megalospora]
MVNVESNLYSRDAGDNSAFAVRMQDGAATEPLIVHGITALQALAHHHHIHLNPQQPRGNNAKLALAGRLCLLLVPLWAPQYQPPPRQEVPPVAQKLQARLLQLLLPLMGLVEVLRAILARGPLLEIVAPAQDFVGKREFSAVKDVKRNGVLLARQLTSVRTMVDVA